MFAFTNLELNRTWSKEDIEKSWEWDPLVLDAIIEKVTAVYADDKEMLNLHMWILKEWGYAINKYHGKS